MTTSAQSAGDGTSPAREVHTGTPAARFRADGDFCPVLFPAHPAMPSDCKARAALVVELASDIHDVVDLLVRSPEQAPPAVLFMVGQRVQQLVSGLCSAVDEAESVQDTRRRLYGVESDGASA
jgi:hypothetical protein